MPSISITEKDLTTGGGTSSNLDVVFVPGFVLNNPSTENWETNLEGTVLTSNFPGKGVPTLCSSLNEFKRYFGKKPANIKDDNNSLIDDKSYIYAVELLKAGLPVMYEAINDISETGTLYESDMRTALQDIYDEEPGTYGNLYDVGEYSFKYLTSGGYPSLNVQLQQSTPNWESLGTDNLSSTVVSNANFVKHLVTLSDLESTGATNFDFICMNITANNSDDVWSCAKFPNATFIGTKNGTTNTYTLGIRYTPQDGDTPVVDALVTFTFNEGNWIDISELNHKITITVTPTVGTDKIEFGYSSTYNVLQNSGTTNTVSDIIADSMRDLAVKRGDCVALIDHPDDENMALVGTGSYHEKLKSFGTVVGSEYCAAFTPWINISYEDNVDGFISMPPSFAYLSALAYSIKTNASWLAVAGAARGQIPGLYTDKPFNITDKITNSIAESVYQKRGGVSINAITNIKPFGNRIWGNRTLKDNSATGEDNLTATSFLNIRNMISDVKKVVYSACKKYTFEQNNDILWLNFKSVVEPTLNQMKNGAGLSGYKIIKTETSEKAKLTAVIKLYPLYAVEDFEIAVEMLDDKVTVS